ncbi:hypothetical protein [Pukyongiella litopenaei]|uniref:DUF2946 domain-containing protein n=1 Tax=Pukyongiella litopenaei TaxID=2605946 RepID=A0A2S0MNZ8_9RHOB|nr:hypothetical protein [Pukyongiella litopenaei]AVO37610.2 hypothetical protein C6Y53_07780 [Pukyongiella litopenaei]
MNLNLPRRLMAAFVLFAALDFAGVGSAHSAARTAAALGPASAGYDLADICGAGGAGDAIAARDCPWCRVAEIVALPGLLCPPMPMVLEPQATRRPDASGRLATPSYGRTPPARAPPRPV